jgi:hypothetical protein
MARDQFQRSKMWQKSAVVATAAMTSHVSNEPLAVPCDSEYSMWDEDWFVVGGCQSIPPWTPVLQREQ